MPSCKDDTTAKQLAEVFGITQRSIEKDLSFLHKNGYIEKTTKGNRSPWIVLASPVRRINVPSKMALKMAPKMALKVALKMTPKMILKVIPKRQIWTSGLSANLFCAQR